MDLPYGTQTKQPSDHGNLSIASAKSQIFRDFLGIRVKVERRTGMISIHSDSNENLFKWTSDEEWKCKWKYHLCATLIESCLLLQIVIAAILIALGASSSSHTVITFFGALNTAIAGILALMKGQGLPHRLRQNWTQLRKVRERIVELDALFRQPDCHLDVNEEVDSIRKMYHAVRDTAENNRPDMYVAQTSRAGRSPTLARMDVSPV